MFIIVLGQHVSTPIESSSGPSKNTDPYFAMFKMLCGIPNAYILDKTMYKMHVSLCSYYAIRILISKTLTGTYGGNVKTLKTMQNVQREYFDADGGSDYRFSVETPCSLASGG